MPDRAAADVVLVPDGGPAAAAPSRAAAGNGGMARDLVLDLGRTTGALLVHAGPADVGTAVEVVRCGGDGTRLAAAVHAWSLSGQVIHVAAFSALPKGAYRLWFGGQLHRSEVLVYGAFVAEIVWTPSAIVPGRWGRRRRRAPAEASPGRTDTTRAPGLRGAARASGPSRAESGPR